MYKLKQFMPTLTDFFQPLNILTLSYFAGLIVFFDILGSYVKHLFIKDKNVDSETRLVNWLIGLAFFVFIWFLAGYVFEPNRTHLLISVALLLVVTLPGYLKRRDYLALVRIAKMLTVPALLVLPILPATLVSASLPPYYSDEMAYHFISPYAMLHQLNTFWSVTTGTLANVPRLMDTFYILTFSLTYTYSVVRLMIFFALVSALFTTFVFIKRNMGNLSAFIFILIFLSLPLNLPMDATVGYVDVPAYSFMLIGLMLGIGYIVIKSKDYLVLSSIFWAMAIGTKYTIFMPFVIYTAVMSIFFILTKKTMRASFDKGFIVRLLFALMIFGGYWYVKNFVVFGNPIYPFLFPCWGKFASYCSVSTAAVFGSWATPINMTTFYPIIKQLLPGNVVLYLAAAISSVVILLFGDRSTKRVFAIIFSLFVLEVAYLKFFSGFYVRYQQHLTFLLIFVIVLLTAAKLNKRFARFIQYSVITLVIASSLISYVKNIEGTKIGLKEKNYALGKSTIHDWIEYILPADTRIAAWCENPPVKPVAIALYDPDTIYGGGDIFVNSYFVNCFFANPNLTLAEWKNFQNIAQERKLQFWSFSINACQEDPSKLTVGQTQDYETRLTMKRISNEIVCNSQEIIPSLYYFNYRKMQ